MGGEVDATRTMHRLLKRQLRRTLGRDAELSDELSSFVDRIDEAYRQYDDDRAMLERSLELSSHELLEANSELRALFTSLPDLFIRVSVDGRVIGTPGGVKNNVNVRDDAAECGPLAEFLVPEACRAIGGARARRVGGGSAKRGRVEYHVGSGDCERHFEARLVPLQRDETMLVIRDVTDGIRATRAESSKREQSARVKAMEEFAYVASHDLRAPLRAIDQLSEWVAEDLDGVADAATMGQLELLRGRVRRMDGLLVGLLDYSRVGSDKVALEEVDVSVLVGGVIDMLDNADFAYDVPKLPVFSTARIPLERVFLNLITNALKHHDKGSGRVAIGFDGRDANMYVFWVEDDGPGIDDKDRGRVFKMFQKLKRRDDVEGSGMGLALIKRVVEDAGGEISLADGIDGGSRFSFTWPRRWRT